MIRRRLDIVTDRWVNLHPFLRFLLLLALVGGLGWLAGKPGYRVFKGWRVERNMAAARKAVAEVRMDAARDLSLTVLRDGDPRLEAYQILEKSTAALRDPTHGDIARALLNHPQSSDEDRLLGFRGIATEVALGLLGQTWAKLAAECQRDPRFATMFADRLITERHLDEAASVLLAVPEAARNGAVQRGLIRVLISSTKNEAHAEAQRLIAAQMPAATTDTDEWLDLLENIPVPGLQPELLAPLRPALQQATGGELPRKALMLARLDYAANTAEGAAEGAAKGAAVVEAAIGRWQESEPAALADFLGDLGLYPRLLEIFPPACLKQHPELLQPMLEAMERCGDWDHVEALLDSQAAHMPKYEELAHRALSAAKTADTTARKLAWGAAMADAKSSPLAGAYLTLQRIARDAGMADEAEQALVAAIHLGQGPLPLYADLKPLLNSLARQGHDNTLLEICASYLAFEPGNPVLLTQFAYLACINHVIEPKTVLKAMNALAGGFPKDSTIQCVLATAYLCDGQAAKAAETLAHLDVEPAKLAPGFRAALLATQVLTHSIPRDDPRIDAFPWKSTLPSERKKFRDLIRGGEAQRNATAAGES